MTVALSVVSILLAGLMAYAAVRKLSHAEAVVESYRRAGVPEDKLNLLAAILLVGAAGLVGGLFWSALGMAAAAGATAYFALAIATHVRARDTANLANPLVMAAVAALLLRLATH